MNQQIVLSIVEIVFSLIIEGIILSLIFSYISDRHTDNQQKNIKSEMNSIEAQNKFIFTQLQQQIENSKVDIMNQIKESGNRKGGN